jgi:putative hydrolase of the HAD superfamily
MIEMVWFDLDDTLYDHSHAVVRAMECIRLQYQALSRYGPHELMILHNQALDAIYPDYLQGNIGLSEMRLRKLKRFFQSAGIPSSEAPDSMEFHRIYDEVYRSTRRATPGSIEAVQAVKRRGVGVAVLTNGTQAVQEDKLRAIGFGFLMPHLLTSEPVGKSKPDPGIFEWALDATGRAARNVVMIGDSLENDVEPALALGIGAVHYSPSSQEREVTTQHGPARVMTVWAQLASLLDTAQRAHLAQ